jgi:predicted PurR-regulated permease PerM
MDNATTPEAGPAPAPAGEGLAPAPQAAATMAVAILAVIAVVAALYLARAFFVPLLIGVLASYSLRPVVEWLLAWRVPRSVGAALVLAAVVGGASWAAFSLGDDAASVIERLPEAARRLREHVSVARAGGPSALHKIQEAATELEGAATDAAGDGKPAKPRRPGTAVRTAEPSAWLRDYMLAQSALLFSVAAQAPIVVLLAYFLLASGEHFRRKLVQFVGPSLARKKDAVRILDEIDTQVQRYLLATVGGNVLVALFTWLAFEALGMEQAGVWGVAAGILHFIPYLGPVVFAIASGVAGFMQIGTALGAITVAGVSLALAATVGQLIMTWLQSRLARVNAAVLFIALLFFGWLWGIWGLLLGAPLVAIAKVVCDRVDALKPAGELLGR